MDLVSLTAIFTLFDRPIEGFSCYSQKAPAPRPSMVPSPDVTAVAAQMKPISFLILNASWVSFNLFAMEAIASRYSKVIGKKKLQDSLKKRHSPERFLNHITTNHRKRENAR